jgi:hypothetical protein
MSFQSDISKLIFHHLVKEGYESSATNLIRECPHLIELKRVQHTSFQGHGTFIQFIGEFN